MNRYGLGWRGKLGDTVFQLATCARLGVGVAVLPDTHRSLERLLLAQPYIAGVEFLPGRKSMEDFSARTPKDAGITHDIDTPTCVTPWERMHLGDRSFFTTPIPVYGLRAFGLPEEGWEKPWLTVPPMWNKSRLLVARSLQYHNGRVEWADVLPDGYVFLGTTEECKAFINAVGRAPSGQIWCSDALGVAWEVAASHAFYCNASLAGALALAMGHPHYLEPPPGYWNTVAPKGGCQVLLAEP